MSILAAYAVPHPPLILPEIGKGEEKKIQLTVNAYERAMKEAAALQPDTVIGRESAHGHVRRLLSHRAGRGGIGQLCAVRRA